jgi:hypothetical protein
MDESGGAGVGNLGWELVVVQAVKLWWRVKEVPVPQERGHDRFETLEA